MPTDVQIETLADDGRFPNNEKLPVLIYRQAVEVSDGEAENRFETTFRGNTWDGIWRNGIYSYHHYHSTAHEVLGVARGTARVQLGGDDGIVLNVDAGDVLVLPAGVAHKNLESSVDFLVVGAYPQGQTWDMNYGQPDERPRTDKNIAETPLPETDPLHGPEGPLRQHWHG